ncbi:MAG: hypothetical protein H6Q15_467 [Bacteroidetes bacterium]|nr:hypothetical protein [Bacteroidota bacterium]
MNKDIFMGLKSFEFYYFIGVLALGIAFFLVLFYFKSPYKEVKQLKKVFFGFILIATVALFFAIIANTFGDYNLIPNAIMNVFFSTTLYLSVSSYVRYLDKKNKIL